MSVQTRFDGDRNNTDIEKGQPFRQNPDKLPEDDTTAPLEAKNYGKSSRLDPDSETTEPEEYHADGLPKTSRYSVHKDGKLEPRVSTPKEKQEEQSDPNDRPDYGF